MSKGFAWTLVVLSLMASSAFAATPALHYQEGSQWTYENTAGVATSRKVEKVQSANSDLGRLYFARVSRSDGSQRYVLRTEKEYFECKDLMEQAGKFVCIAPLQIVKWPMMVGDSWSSSEIEFKVLEEGQTPGPDEEETSYYRVAYQPIGADSPIGEFWFSPKWGNLKIDEGDDVYQLTAFQMGTGKKLTPTRAAVLKEVLAPSSLPIHKPSTGLRINLPSDWIVPIGITLVLLVPILFLLVGVLGALRKGQEEELPEPDPNEELKLLSAIATGGDYRQARERLQKLTQQYPNYPDLRHQLALVYRAEGRLEEAKKTWLDVLDRKPEYTDAQFGLAELYFSMGEFEEASSVFEAILDIHPNYADARLGLGKSLYRMGEKEKALEALDEALRINPHYEEARRLLDTWRDSAQVS